MCTFALPANLDFARFREKLSALFFPYGTLSEGQLDLLERHYRLLLTWNQRLNLTRVTDVDDAVRVHYGESLFLATVLPAGPLRIADVGSGAGFPGLPIGVLRSECQVDLIEGHQRKAVFLREACRGLSNFQVISTRAENIKTQYDWVVSRAVAEEEVLRLNLAPDVGLLGSTGSIEVPFNRGHFIRLFHVKH